MKNRKRRIRMIKKLLLLAFAALVLSGCGGGNVAYAPSAFGPYGHCYYLYSPYECYGHHYGAPMLMPLYWHERYAAYYDSPAYIQSYVPSRYRSTATTRARTFERTYASGIRQQSKTATWKGSNGKTVSGSKLSRSATFGSGGARSSGYSGGSMRKSSSGNPCAAVHRVLEASAVFVRGGSSGGSSGGGRSGGSISSGGSARSGGSVGSKTGSRNGRNC